MRRLAARIACISGCVALVATVGLVLVGGAASAGATPLEANAPVDATMSPGQSVDFKHPTALTGTELIFQPHACRGEVHTVDDTAGPLVCKSYRVVLNLDPSPKALNTVIFEARFNQTSLPSLPLVALGLNPPPVGGVDVYVYDKEDHYLGENSTTDANDESPGGATFNEPEIGSFVAKQRVYDITVQGQAGPNTDGFDLHLTFSNEIFTAPHEVLDQFGNTASPTDTSSPEPTFTPPPDTSTAAPTITLPEAAIAPDQDIAGIGLGTTQEFNPNGFALPPRTRDVAATAKPPSGVALVLGLVAFPIVVAAIGVALLRKRRQALLT